MSRRRSVLGVDLSSHKISTVELSYSGTFTPREFEAEGKLAAQRLLPLVHWFDGLLASLPHADKVYVEGLPFIRNKAAFLSLALVLGAVWTVCALRDRECVVVNGADWKKGLGLPGNANKSRISEWVDARVSERLAAQLISQDLKDAYCIARYALERENA